MIKDSTDDLDSYENNLSFGLLTYLSRSGSTFLSNLLNDYQEVCVTLEGSLPAELFGILGYSELVFTEESEIYSYLEFAFRESRLSTWPITIDDVMALVSFNGTNQVTGSELLKTLLRAYRNKVNPLAKVVIYKGSPMMPRCVSQLSQQMADWKVIHLIRDPRSVYSSQKRNFRPYHNTKFANSPFKVAYYWKKGLEEIQKNTTNEILTVKYENLLLNKDSTLFTINTFLNVSDKKANQNDFKSLIPDEERSIHTKVGKEPNTDRIKAWENELQSEEIDLINSYLKEYLNNYDYAFKQSDKTCSLKLKVLSESLKLFMRNKVDRLKIIIKGLIKNPKYYFQKILLRFKK